MSDGDNDIYAGDSDVVVDNVDGDVNVIIDIDDVGYYYC